MAPTAKLERHGLASAPPARRHPTGVDAGKTLNGGTVPHGYGGIMRKLCRRRTSSGAHRDQQRHSLPQASTVGVGARGVPADHALLESRGEAADVSRALQARSGKRRRRGRTRALRAVNAQAHPLPTPAEATVVGPSRVDIHPSAPTPRPAIQFPMSLAPAGPWISGDGS